MIQTKITFIGAGNVSWHLAQTLDDAGHMVQEVYSRHFEAASQLAARLYNATATQSLDFSASKATIFIISIPDDAIAAIVSKLILPGNAILVHTSGSLTLDVLASHPHTGVFYPLQTFSKARKVKIREVPFCIEANDEATENLLVTLAQHISDTVYIISSAERKVLHIAAVFACNFTNHLLAIARQITNREELEFELLKPIIQETIQKALSTSNPATVQTGPAIRHDNKIIENHLDYLRTYPSQYQIYKLITESISKRDAD